MPAIYKQRRETWRFTQQRPSSVTWSRMGRAALSILSCGWSRLCSEGKELPDLTLSLQSGGIFSFNSSSLSYKTITSLSCRLARKLFLTTMTLHSTFVRYIQKGKMCNMAAQYVWKQYMQEIFWIRSTANLVFQLIFVPDSNLSSHDCPLLFSAFSSLTLYEATAEWKE